MIDFGVIFDTWGELALYKRHLVVAAAAFVTVGALSSASAYAGTSAGASHAAGSSGGTITGNAVAGKNAVKHFTSPLVGTLTADIQFSDLGTRAIQADVNGSTDITINLTNLTPAANCTITASQ